MSNILLLYPEERELERVLVHRRLVARVLEAVADVVAQLRKVLAGAVAAAVVGAGGAAAAFARVAVEALAVARGAVADALNLFETMADIKHGTAFGLQLLVARQIADAFLDLAANILGSPFNAIFISHETSP